MQPLVLKMTAFGPYKQTETIDFRNLERHKLFVISGSTGAGKTTIFDGICFALFGSASGSDRDNQTMLRSDFADDETHMSVELTFELNQRTYRILRQLGHVKKGNKSKTGERYEFYEQKDEKEVPCVDRQIVSEIDEKVERLLGLTEDQFKQIVMLPQGEFRKLLTSKTENKEAILRKLFKTESYQQINERLKIKKDNAEESYRRKSQARDMYIQNIRASLPERDNSLLYHVLSEEHYNSHQVIAVLEEEVTYYEGRITIDDAAYKKAYEAHDEKQTHFHKAQIINEQFDTLDNKHKRLKELTEQIPVFTSKEKQLDSAERASNITLYEKQLEDWNTTAEEKKKALYEAENAKTSADKTFDKVQIIYEQEKNKQDKREEAGKRLDRLQQFLPVVKDIDTRLKELDERKREVKQASEYYEQVTTELQKKEHTLKAYEEKMQKIEAALNELPQKEDRLKEMREEHRILKQYIQLKDKHTALAKDLTQKKEMYKRSKTTYDTYEKKWLNSQASILATHLHEGEACPVCGSLTHPEKAMNDHTMTTKEELQALKTDLEQKNNAYLTVHTEAKSCLRQMEESAEELQAKDIPKEDANATYDRLLEDGKQLSEEVNKLKTTRNELTQIKQTYEAEKEDRKKLENTKEKRNTDLQSLKITLTKQQTVFEERLREVPEEVRVLPELEKQITASKEQKEKLDNDWDKAQKDLQLAKDEQTKATSNLAHSKKQLDESNSKREEADKEFNQVLTNASFTSIDSYKEAKMSPNEQQELKKEIDTFKQNFETVKQQVHDLKKDLGRQTRTDLAALEEELSEFKRATEAALHKRDQSRNYHRDATKLLQDIIKASVDVKAQEEKLQMVADLYDVMRGQNTQKISFERYLQIEYLEQIIYTANLRLKHLSNGQFLLMRSDRQESHGRQSGLAFDVYDAYTGQTRDVKTLSGGEKFNTSLCLALGMSDVIQSFQGNVSMKTMFIDEGFGSLDEESLHKAIDALVELQKSGRTIGVISHVQELKAILPAALEVMKTKEGSSHTEFVLK